MKKTSNLFKQPCHLLWHLILVASTAGSLLAGTLTTDFNTDPGGQLLGKAKIENGILKLQDLQELLDGTSNLPMHGSYVFPDIDPGQKVAAFTANFRVSIHGGTETPAQGFSFVLAPDLASRTTPFREGGGDTTGLVISFDTVDNLPGFEAEGNESGDAPGIIVKLGGQRVTAQRFAGLRTGPANNQTPNFVPVEIRLEADGTLNVTYNGVRVLNNVSIPYAPIAGQFGVGAGTAELTAAIRANHWFDNMSLTTTPVSPGPVLLSALPLGTQVRPDALLEARIENLGGATVQLEFDGVVVTPSVSTSAGVTTVSYDPPGLLAAGSSHLVRLTYGSRTLRWSFAVMNVPSLPASFALEAGAVDPTRGGFKVRVHQLEDTAPGGNSYQRAIRQLAGELGPNVADLSLANPDGTFDRDLINFEQDGGEAGAFSFSNGFADEFFPGIPGTTGSTDNIAMEATGFLDLAPGVYTFGMVSDDNARLTIGPHPRDVTGLIVADTVIGTVRGTFVVTQAGLYPFSLVWAEGGGGAHVELWTEDATGRGVLVNARNTAGHVKAYRQLRAGVNLAPYLSRAKPAPGDGNVSTSPRLELELSEEGSTVNLGSIRLSLNGQPVTLAGGAVTRSGNKVAITHRVSDPLEGLAVQTVRLEYTDSANRSAVREYTFTTGASQTGGFAGGQWDFDRGDLSATLGRPLGLIDSTLASRYRFGTTAQFGIPGIGGREARVLHIPHVDGSESDARGPLFKRLGLRMNHAMPPNGGGQKVNQWTLIMDLYWGENGSGFGSILQTHDFDNPTDGDMFWRASDGSYGKGCCSNYDGISQEQGRNHRRGEWARVVFVVDLASTPRKVAKYVNGHKHREDVGGDGNALDSRFALPPEVFLFGDGDDNERSEAYVNSMQIRAGTMTDEEVAALGGPSADGIPLPFAQWDFDKGSLAATVGQDLGYIDATLASRYRFGTTTQFGIPGIGGREARVLHIPHVDGSEADARGPIFKRLGLRMNHGLGANGGGQKLNQWTWVMDLYWGENGTGFGSILQTHDFDNPTDGDMFWRASDGSYGKGCCSNYDGISQEPGRNHRRGEWARVVFVVDLASTPRKVAKYVNGHKHREDVGGDGNALDSRFALPPEVFLFGDGDDNERSEAYVNSMQIRAGTMTDEEVAALGGPSADGIPLPLPLKGEWNFEGNLAAALGKDLGYIDATLASRYRFGTTTQFGIPGIGGREARVLHIPHVDGSESDARGPIFKRLGLRAGHGIPPNGGGQKVNQWTWVMDLYWGENGTGFGSILQTHDFDNPTDGDMFWRASDGSYGKGCCSNYDGISQEPGRNHRRGEWARVVFVVDLASTPRKVAKYVNGHKHREDVGGDGNALDSRFALPPEVFLFGDGDDNERSEAYLAAMQFREGTLTDDEVAALGGPSPYGIPWPAPAARRVAPPVTPTITVQRSGANVVLTWTGALQSADRVEGPYTDVSGASSPLSVPATGAAKFYRARR